MKVLCVDTTTVDLVVAIVHENKIEDFSVRGCGTRHSETLCNRVDFALKQSGLTFSDIDAFACCIGPGSFTGIRIGIATLKGYLFACGKPAVSFSSLHAIAVSSNCGETGSAVVDAGNGYYFADFSNGVAPRLISYEDQRAKNAGRCNGACDYLDGAVKIVRDAFVKGNFSQSLSPLYIRRSQAEEHR